ncbi:MAG: hypothetical protein QFB87_02745 [Patescibacteria group bacterium]|nr:hypothetical protein [Patescibacteria group bacterium]
MYEKSEAQRSFNRRFAKVFAGAVVLGVVAIAAANEYDKAHPKPAVRYMNEFTEHGKCLDNTPYDPDKGASLTVDNHILTVLPRAANSYTPSVLQFVVGHNDIHFSDHQTGTLLVDAGCIDANSGQ